MASTKVVCKDGFSFHVGWGVGFQCVPRKEGADGYSRVEVAWWNRPDPALKKILGQAIDPDTLLDLISSHGGIESIDEPLPEMEWPNDLDYFAALAKYGDLINQLSGEHNE